MIRYITRAEINIEKYNSCIQSAFNSRVYAFSWYLDIVADNWDALILNDYEAVMPLPWRQKFFIKYIYPPVWTQQLGVFSKDSISEVLILNFMKAIPSKFKKVTIQFNSKNKFHDKNLAERVNYILPLNKPYKEIYKGFNKNRKRVLKSNKNEFSFNYNIEENTFFSFIQNQKSTFKLSQYQKSKLKELLKLNCVQIYGIEVNQSLVSCVIWLKDNERLTYLFSASSSIGKESGTQTFLVDNVIRKNKKSNLIIDFEGSMLPGIAQFYKGFGAIEEKYFFVKKNYFNKSYSLLLFFFE